MMTVTMTIGMTIVVVNVVPTGAMRIATTIGMNDLRGATKTSRAEKTDVGTRSAARRRLFRISSSFSSWRWPLLFCGAGSRTDRGMLTRSRATRQVRSPMMTESTFCSSAAIRG
jgi:hypothetical protein